MINCVISKFIKCECQILKEYLPFLVKNVNKLQDATGCPEKRLDYVAGFDAPEDIMRRSIDSIKAVIPKLESQRLNAVAAEDAANAAEAEILQLKQKIIEAEEKSREDIQKSVSAPALDGNYKKLALALIKFRDQLLYFKEESEKEGSEQSVKLLKNLYRETGRIMSANGIEPLQDEGAYDEQKHVISSTVPTDDTALTDTIADTFRPGYKINGELIRPQEVVIYINDNN